MGAGAVGEFLSLADLKNDNAAQYSEKYATNGKLHQRMPQQRANIPGT
jgi:hypothetical protein